MSIIPALRSVTVPLARDGGTARAPHLGGHLPDVGTLTCHLCGGEVHSDCDPQRNGWLHCASCGPAYMPLAGRWIRVHVACSLPEASERVGRLLIGLGGANSW